MNELDELIEGKPETGIRPKVQNTILFQITKFTINKGVLGLIMVYHTGVSRVIFFLGKY